MIKGSREATLRGVQPMNIHGQVLLNVQYVYADGDVEQIRVARVGPEAMAPDLEPGDRIRLEYVLGQVISITRA